MPFEFRGFPIYFREWREHVRLSQRQLAEIMDTSKPVVSRIENGTRRFHTEYMIDFAIAVGLVDPKSDERGGWLTPLSRPPHPAEPVVPPSPQEREKRRCEIAQLHLQQKVVHHANGHSHEECVDNHSAKKTGPKNK